MWATTRNAIGKGRPPPDCRSFNWIAEKIRSATSCRWCNTASALEYGRDLATLMTPTEMHGPELRDAVAARFYAVNGTFPMTPEDDAYVSEWYVALEVLAEEVGVPADQLRKLMLANRLPLPSYIRSDGT